MESNATLAGLRIAAASHGVKFSDTSECASCGKPITFGGMYWVHDDIGYNPRHSATPRRDTIRIAAAKPKEPESCKTCLCWFSDGVEETGECRFNPPDCHGLFSLSRSSDWCRKHEVRA